MRDILGVIFPIPKQFVDRLFVENRNVFVKYVARNSGLKLAQRNKVLFYESHSSKEIVGEGRIEDICFLTPSDAFKKYGSKLFLNEEEMAQYTLLQPNRDSSKKILVIVLAKLRRYSKPKKFKKPINMAGQYLTKRDYIDLLG